MPPWGFFLGNIPALAALNKHVPKDARQAESFALLSSESPGLESCFYVDVWPFGFPILVITSPELAVQTCQTHDLGKPDVLAPFIAPMAGGSSFFDSNGMEWKRSRDLFHHAFSMKASMEHIPQIVEEAETFVDILREHAEKQGIFLLDQETCNCVMDIVGNVALDTRFHSQRKYNPIATSMRDTIDWECRIETGNPFSRLSPIRWFKQWHNGRTMNHHIGIELEKRYQEWKDKKPTDPAKAKSIMDLVIAEYMKTRPVSPMLEPQFKAWAIVQIRLFLFVGHDSTAVTIVYCLYLLSKHPALLAKVRAEHDTVFGTDLASSTKLLKQRPELINRLPYTTAVVKETLRLYPPANGLRQGIPNVSLRDPQTGKTFPTEGFALWVLHSGVHRNAHHWPDPHSFIPDRWLTPHGHPLYPPAGAWRPFEHGPRDCIGQNIALLDVKVTLVMTVREFDFHDQYAEWDRLHPSRGPNTMFGERAYLVQKGSGHPAQGCPCRVALREGSE
ncbi:putative sterigmatocystin biosynthesis P450 monooxygenase stcS [Talaromyces islandicus]|uniref:Putative sterigmatocystin biosynthesis P450 monooxygenase stcS n=1 Tax=Talaromyces islandicus TaxID=28573 RepID=A0A0U1M5V1_TALIS|nr:putative sterigmatocystin biosynthesis P450 monooxygenase stcS [Talaromyces islandicus]